METVHKRSDSECYTPSSEPFRFSKDSYCLILEIIKEISI
jgi:hypothetical protein